MYDGTQSKPVQLFMHVSMYVHLLCIYILPLNINLRLLILGEVKGDTVVRYWEEKGGGLDALRTRLSQTKRKSRYAKIKRQSK